MDATLINNKKKHEPCYNTDKDLMTLISSLFSSCYVAFTDITKYIDVRKLY